MSKKICKKLEIKNLRVDVAGMSESPNRDNKTVVEDVSLTVLSGEVHIIMGPNGSGKSSLVNAIFNHPRYKISGGKILLDKEEITNDSVYKKSHKGLFLSTQYLPEIDGVTLMVFLHKSYNALKGLKTPILEFNKYLMGLACEIGIDVSFLGRALNFGLSGGEKKQSEVLQLLALEPDFAFLDEIDSGVDIDSINKVVKGINVLRKKGTGFVLITHNTKILKKLTPDIIHIMKEGRIIKSGGVGIVKEVEKSGFGDKR